MFFSASQPWLLPSKISPSTAAQALCYLFHLLTDLSSALSSKLIKFTTGREPDSKKFFVHRGLLQARSSIPEFFNKNASLLVDILVEKHITRDNKGNMCLEHDNRKLFRYSSIFSTKNCSHSMSTRFIAFLRYISYARN
jgi:hypothetical protein